MKTRDYTNKTGKIATYHLEQELPKLVTIDKDKPSSRIIQTKKGKKAIAGLIDIENNRNHSWYQELKNKTKDKGNEVALFYRGNKITFDEMFKKADNVAKSLLNLGIEKGDEIPCCISNTPELVYILLGANKIGAKLNMFGNHLDSDYLNEVLDSCTKKLFIATDDTYDKIANSVQEKQYKNKLLISLQDSLLEKPELSDEYEKSLDSYYHYDNLVPKFKQNDVQNNILSFEEFLNKSANYNKTLVDDNDLNTEFLVTYTSGSTSIGFPKQIIHSNRSLITSGRFHDSELSGNPEIKGLRGLAHIHTESNTNVITCISDNLMQGWSVALEPEYDKNKALDYIIINKPNYLNMTTSFLIEVAKEYLYEKKHHGVTTGKKLPFLLATFAVGESTSKGEEKLINKFLRTSKAGSGIKIKGLSMPFTTLSIGGGDCEHGGIYYSLWKSMYEKLNYFKLKNREYGLIPEPFAQVSAFKLLDNGLYQECDYNEYGLIAANSATTMVGYKNNGEKTKDLIISDTDERDWISSNVYGYIDELGGVHVKGRLGNEINFSNGMSVPNFVIEDMVSKDTKNILSCSITKVVDTGKEIPIINIELQPESKQNKLMAIQSMCNRIAKKFPNEVVEDFGFRFFDDCNQFPLNGSGKRSIPEIEKMKLQNVLKISNNRLKPYIQQKNNSKQLIKK